MQVRQAHPFPGLQGGEVVAAENCTASEVGAQPLEQIAQSLKVLHTRVHEIDGTAGTAISEEVSFCQLPQILLPLPRDGKTHS
jgi:hypothetical protein